MLDGKTAGITQVFQINWCINGEKTESIRIGDIHLRQRNTHIDAVHDAQHFVSKQSTFAAIGMNSIALMDKIPWLADGAGGC